MPKGRNVPPPTPSAAHGDMDPEEREAYARFLRERWYALAALVPLSIYAILGLTGDNMSLSPVRIRPGLPHVVVLSMTEQHLVTQARGADSGTLVSTQPSMTSQTYASASSAPNTRRAYRADWADFTAWCAQAGRESLPATPVTVADYLAACAAGEDGRPARAVATLDRRLVAIARAHQLAGHTSPTSDEWVRTVLKGIRRARSTAQRRVSPIGIAMLRQIVAVLPATLLGTRDRALLLLGFAAALRRSELIALDLDDIQFVPEGLVLRLRRSKTDQTGEGLIKGIPLGQSAATCPVRALQAWIKQAKLIDGPLFSPLDRHGHVRPKQLNGSDVAVIVKRSVAAAGFDPDQYSGHSLRAGLATAAASAGAPTYAIRKQTGHKSDRMLELYIREGSLFRDNVAGMVGL